MRTSAERRARRRNLFVEKVDKRTVWDRADGVCGICRTPVKFEAMTMDHIVPLAKGGLHSFANIQLAHEECNLRKGDMLESDYVQTKARRKLSYLNRPNLAKAS